MTRNADISENQLLAEFGEKVCSDLLTDRTTRQNIYWATDSYARLGDGFTFFDPITLDKITSYISCSGKVITGKQYQSLLKEDSESGNGCQEIIRPRALKSKEVQTRRIKDKAEVFTPAWICNLQNNLVDEAWFGRKDGLFNSADPADSRRWIDIESPVSFPSASGKTWKDYVADTRMEITCGEAPYLCNRYDAVSGEYNGNVKYRIGLLDRKLRIVSENAGSSEDWILWGLVALRATYGFEWQGDNLLLAREAVFFTFKEHYTARFGDRQFERIKDRVMPRAAYIISWNIWQMDGLKFGLPGFEPYKKKKQAEGEGCLFAGQEDWENGAVPEREPLPGERLCLVKDFFKGLDLNGETLSEADFDDAGAPTTTFESMVEGKTKQ